jgi:hypothetical protein
MKLVKKIKDVFQGKSTLYQKRSNRWDKTRRDYLQKHPTCVICGSKKKLEVHHKLPFNLRPDLELEESNLIPLCETKKYGIVCHLLVGHLGCYRSYNPEVEQDAQIWHAKLIKAKMQ